MVHSTQIHKKQPANILKVSLMLLFAVFIPSVAEAATIDYKVIEQNLRALIPFVAATSYVMGVVFITVAVFKLKRYGEMRTMMSSNVNIAGKISLIIVGLMLLYLPTTLETFNLTIFGNSQVELFSDQQNFGAASEVMKVVVLAIRLIGLISFVRGCVILSKLGAEGGAQPGMMGKGMLHIIGGILAWNILATWNVVLASIGYSS